MMKTFGRLKELLKIEPLIIRGWCKEKTEERIFIKKYRGFDIYTSYGDYSETTYTTSIVTEKTFPSGSNYYGTGFYVLAYAPKGGLEIAYWVRVKTPEMRSLIHTVNSEILVKKGISKAIHKIEKYIDWAIAFSKKLNDRWDKEKQLEKKVKTAIYKNNLTGERK